MKTLVLLLIIAGCSRDCSVYCGIKNECKVVFRDWYEARYSAELDNLPTEQANNACIQYKNTGTLELTKTSR